MKRSTLIIAGIVFVVTLVAMLIIAGVQKNSASNYCEEMEQESVVVRYYLDDGANASLYYFRVTKDEPFTIPVIPQKQGMAFDGLYAKKNGEISTQYVDSTGQSVVSLQKDIVLYPGFAVGVD